MKIHRNAKTTPAARAALVHRVLHEDWTNAATAASAIESTATAGARRRGPAGSMCTVAIDDHSRVAYVEVLPDQRGETCAAFLTRSVAWFADRAITVRRVMSDNGSGYVSRWFRAACYTLHLRHLRTRPYTSRTNGKAERFIQTLLREWAYAAAYPSSACRTRQLALFLRYYNRRRPHANLDYHAPWSRFPSAA